MAAVTVIIVFCCVFIWYFTSHAHATAQMAIRTYLLASGHPICAFTTGIKDDDLHNRIDKQSLKDQNAKCYSLTRPPLDESGNYLINFIVIKKDSLYYAKYYGEA